MKRVWSLLDPFTGIRAYFIGIMFVVAGTQFVSDKNLAALFAVTGMVLIVARPFFELGSKDTSEQ